MDFTDVLMLKVWPILADTDTDIKIGASLIYIPVRRQIKRWITYNLLTG